MKQLFILVLSCFITGITVQAQQDARTTTTKIADLLAQLPATNHTQQEKAMKDMSGLGESGLVQLISMFVPVTEGDNSRLEYAISGYSAYVTENNREALRKAASRAYCAGLQKINDRYNKQFLVTQIQITGKDESVDCLASLLQDRNLYGAAARALATLNTAASGNALLSGLKNAGDSVEIAITDALGDMEFEPSLKTLTAMLPASAGSLKGSLLRAIASIGDPASESILAAEAKEARYKLDDNHAVAAYLRYAKNLAKNGHTQEALKVAKQINTEAARAGQTAARIAGLELASEIQKQNSLPQLVAASGDPDPAYRAAALKFAMPFVSAENSGLFLKKMKSASPEVQAEILSMLGNLALPAATKELSNYIRNGKTPEVRRAALAALGKTGDEQAIDFALGMMKSDSPEDIRVAEDALLMNSSKNLDNRLVKALPALKQPAQLAVMRILNQRRSGNAFGEISKLLDSRDTTVRQMAYASLAGVSGKDHLPALFDLLNKGTNQNEIAAVQNAIIAVLPELTAEKRQSAILDKMATAPTAQKPLYYPLLPAVGGQEALNVVYTAYQQGNETDQNMALRALTNWKNAEAIDALLSISQKENKEADKNRVLGAYIRLVSASGFPDAQKVLLLRKAANTAKSDAQKKAVIRALENIKTFPSMMAAARYLDDKGVQQDAGRAVMNIALSDTSFSGSLVRDYLQKTMGILKGGDAEYEIKSIVKYLAEMPGGEGYVRIFNGKDLEGWKGLVANPIKRAQMDAATLEKEQQKADDIMRKGWIVENGDLIFTGKGDNIATKKTYGDFEMLVDWKIYDDGNKDGDAGVYLRGTPQVQMWDTSRRDVGAQVGSGGLYNNIKHESKPLKIADNPLGEWNHFYIKMIGDKVTVYLNGELVTDNVVLENYWDRSKPIFPEEQLELQAHGSRVAYRDIYVRDLSVAKPFELSADEQKEGFEVLFDGRDLDKWQGNKTDYVVDNGNLVIRPKSGSHGNLYTKEEFGDFTFRFEFKLTPGANNGLGIRAPLEGDAAYTGMELQILDNEADIYKDLKQYQYHGSVYGVIPAKRGYLKPVGEWNYQEVIVKGPKIKVILNGTTILDGDLTEARKKGTLDGNKHPGIFREKGYIGFLGHGSEVYFRNIRVKRAH